MQILHQILAVIGELAINTTSFLGYPGIFILMTLESMIFPLPSEVVMPFAGFLVATGRFKLWLVILASSLGSLFGSLLSYYMGVWGGQKLVLRWGKYLLLDETDLLKTEAWFSRRGEITILIGRFVPVVRHLISIPAGIGKMNLRKFSIYTLIGATIWNTFLIYLGILLKENWSSIEKYFDQISITAALFLLIGGIYFIYRHIKHKRKI